MLHVHVSVSFAKYGTLTALTIFGHKRGAHEFVEGEGRLEKPETGIRNRNGNGNRNRNRNRNSNVKGNQYKNRDII